MNSVRPCTVLQSPNRALGGSVLLHGVLLAMVLSLDFTGALPVSRIRATPVVLIAPARDRPLAPRTRQLVAPPRATSSLPSPRAFIAPHAPEARPAFRPTIQAPEPLRLVLQPLAPEVPRAALTLTPPPLKTDNLDNRADAPSPVQRQVVKASGFSSIEASSQGSPRRGLAVAGAFDAAAPAKPVAPRETTTTRAGFGDATVAATAPLIRAAAPVAPLTPVEIQFKPRPAYTDEARRLQIQGEVLLEVVFGASGEASVERVVRGLGHGLDESAQAAARGIRFRPARRDGAAVDFQAIVHIVFELAQ